ncbi:AAA family ATPase, partial [Streptomyces sp. NPDC087850]|uniref:AAA family ATPase n=1 Tax=Streptomyces sp. NPDC087850 TaxID=3365809 RepID=UPI0038117A6A
MITRIELEGFRSFCDCAVDLSPFTVLVGQNGSGKTNLLEAVDLAAQLVGESASYDWWSVGETLRWDADLRPGGDRRGRIVDLFHRRGDGAASDRIRIVVCFLDSDPDRGMRHVKLAVDITREGETGRPGVDGTVTLLPDAPDSWELAEERRAEIRRNAHLETASLPLCEVHWDRLVPDAGAARQDADLHDGQPMDRDARNLSAVLGRLVGDGRTGTRDALLLKADAVAVLPGLTDLRSAPDVDRGVWELDLVYRDAAPTPARLASDGTLHVLAVLAAAHDGTGPMSAVGPGKFLNDCSTLMIEDVDNGLHPGQVKELVRRLRRCTGAAALQQIIVTTHSPVVLAAVYPDHPGDVLFV